MTGTKTYTFTQEEKFILDCLEEAKKDEIPASAISNRAREAEQIPDFSMRLSKELILTCLGQLIERGLIHRIEISPGEFSYGRA